MRPSMTITWGSISSFPPRRSCVDRCQLNLTYVVITNVFVAVLVPKKACCMKLAEASSSVGRLDLNQAHLCCFPKAARSFGLRYAP